MDKEIGIFEEDSLYQLIIDSSNEYYKYGDIIVLCTRGNYYHAAYNIPLWEGIVVFSSTSLENHTPVYPTGFKCDTWNSELKFWKKIEHIENELNTKNRESSDG